MKVKNLAKHLGLNEQSVYGRIRRRGYEAREFSNLPTKMQLELLDTNIFGSAKPKWTFVFDDGKFEFSFENQVFKGTTSAKTEHEFVKMIRRSFDGWYRQNPDAEDVKFTEQ